jgi:Leucine-rich repeat (LRR) protein
MDFLDKLSVLNLNANKLESLESMPKLGALTELVLDGNPIANAKELLHLQKLTKLVSLSMAGCPLAEEKGDEFKKEVLIALMDSCPNLIKINGEPYTPEDLAEAKTLRDERIEAEKNKPPAEEGAEGEGEGEEPADE